MKATATSAATAQTGRSSPTTSPSRAQPLSVQPPSPGMRRPSSTSLLLLWLAVTAAALGCLGGPRTAAEAVPHSGPECYRQDLKLSCLMGCFSCWRDFGRDVYDMAACCTKCRLSQAWLVDEGPTRCSLENTKTSWRKRLGK